MAVDDICSLEGQRGVSGGGELEPFSSVLSGKLHHTNEAPCLIWALIFFFLQNGTKSGSPAPWVVLENVKPFIFL